MPSLKGLAVGVGAVIVVGYIALRTKAGEGLLQMATGVTKAVASPFAGLGEGLGILGTGISAALSPTIAPTIAPKFDWSQWLPFGNGAINGNGNGNGVRQEDRNGNGNGNGLIAVVMTGGTTPRTTRPGGTEPTLPGFKPRTEDRTTRKYIAL